MLQPITLHLQPENKILMKARPNLAALPMNVNSCVRNVYLASQTDNTRCIHASMGYTDSIAP